MPSSLSASVSAAASTSNSPVRPGDSGWIVAKVGGTSVAKFIDAIPDSIIPAAHATGHKIVVVCSARSGDSKATGTTNLLLRAATEALLDDAATEGQAMEPANDRYASPPRTPSLSMSNSLRNGLPHRTASSTLLSQYNQSPARSASPAPFNRMASSISSLRSLDEALVSENGASSSCSSPTHASPVPAFLLTVEQIRSDHLKAAKKAVRDPDLLAELEQDLEADCDRLRSFLLAAQIINEISIRSKDIIMGVGEKLSCRIVAAVLRDKVRVFSLSVVVHSLCSATMIRVQGIDSELVTLESIVEKDAEELRPQPRSGSAELPQLDQALYARLCDRLRDRLLQCEDRVPVVTGFFGVVPGSLLSQIGRGYTDLCAALCAVGLGAAELQIWKEVDGIFTADPRKVPTARLLPLITPEEAAELTYYGSEVIHPFTMEQVINAAIPIRIKNVENPLGSGTVIFPDVSNTTTTRPPSPNGLTRPGTPSSSEESAAVVAVDRSAYFHANGYYGASKTRKTPTAVTIKDQILVLNVRSNRKTISHGFFARTFTVLDRHGIIVDLISTSEVQLSLSMHGVFKKGLLDRVVADLASVGEVTFKRDMAILSLVGKQMRNMVGIAGKMFTCAFHPFSPSLVSSLIGSASQSTSGRQHQY